MKTEARTERLVTTTTEPAPRQRESVASHEQQQRVNDRFDRRASADPQPLVARVRHETSAAANSTLPLIPARALAQFSGAPSVAKGSWLNALLGKSHALTGATNAMSAATSPAAAAASPGKAAADFVNTAYAVHKGHDPRAAANAVRDEVKNLKSNPAELKVFLEAVKPTLDQMAHDLVNVPKRERGDLHETVKALNEAANEGGKEFSDAIGHAIANAVPKELVRSAVPNEGDDYVSPDENFTEVVQSLRAGRLDSSLALLSSTSVALKETDKAARASEAQSALTTEVQLITSDYQAAKARCDELNKEIEPYLQKYGQLLSPAQMKQALDAFHAKHQAEFDALEAKAGDFIRSKEVITELAKPNGPLATSWVALPPGVYGPPSPQASPSREAATAALLNVFPSLEKTTVGAQAIADAIEAKGRGETTWLDGLKVAADGMSEADFEKLKDQSLDAEGIKSAQEFTKNIGTVIFRSTTVSLGAAPENAEAILKNLKATAPILGLDEARLESVTTHIGDLARETDDARRTVLQGELKEELGSIEILNPATRTGQAFGALSVLVGGLAVSKDFAHWGSLEWNKQVAAVSNTVGLGAEGVLTVVGALGKASSLTAVTSVAGKVGAIGGAISALCQAVDAERAFSEGKTIEGLSDSFGAAGGLVLAGAALCESGVGAIVGGVLAGIGFALGGWAKADETSKDEGPSKEFLKSAGFSDATADALSNHSGDGVAPSYALIAVANHLHIPPAQLMERLAQLDDDAIHHIIEDGAHNVELDDDNKLVQSDAENEEAMRNIGHESVWNMGFSAFRGEPDLPNCVNGLAIWLDKLGVLPANVHA